MADNTQQSPEINKNMQSAITTGMADNIKLTSTIAICEHLA
jgi:hypothetical protein